MVSRVPPGVRLPLVDQIKLDLLLGITDSCQILRVTGLDEKLNIHNVSFGWADYGIGTQSLQSLSNLTVNS